MVYNQCFFYTATCTPVLLEIFEFPFVYGTGYSRVDWVVT
ncbi:hypothetical protein M097_1718 [Phocaeicola vulgatus str. 3775 SL(B) 10 (iv)]|uniref:Uncharacterized protein n=1 Tax=Phocaeicola vulgatus str. 3775 SL(B) 10 (iv) TaxID=1339350 RepID=A0A078R897_PHOVU|nr:hypothetical protein M097_1718 [Phocaeicola vulgatus str. 3775 SL(B) 10 (iv)]